jgi:large subunit ribosomal protein L24e
MEKATGRTFATKTGDVLRFCSSKCYKNWKMGRSPLRLGWTKKTAGGKPKTEAKK